MASYREERRGKGRNVRRAGSLGGATRHAARHVCIHIGRTINSRHWDEAGHAPVFSVYSFGTLTAVVRTSEVTTDPLSHIVSRLRRF